MVLPNLVIFNSLGFLLLVSMLFLLEQVCIHTKCTQFSNYPFNIRIYILFSEQKLYVCLYACIHKQLQICNNVTKRLCHNNKYRFPNLHFLLPVNTKLFCVVYIITQRRIILLVTTLFLPFYSLWIICIWNVATEHHTY